MLSGGYYLILFSYTEHSSFVRLNGYNTDARSIYFFTLTVFRLVRFLIERYLIYGFEHFYFSLHLCFRIVVRVQYHVVFCYVYWFAISFF